LIILSFSLLYCIHRFFFIFAPFCKLLDFARYGFRSSAFSVNPRWWWLNSNMVRVNWAYRSQLQIQNWGFACHLVQRWFTIFYTSLFFDCFIEISLYYEGLKPKETKNQKNEEDDTKDNDDICSYMTAVIFLFGILLFLRLGKLLWTITDATARCGCTRRWFRFWDVEIAKHVLVTLIFGEERLARLNNKIIWVVL
jgi:hypothetical protein